jgi:hypothetical protein
MMISFYQKFFCGSKLSKAQAQIIDLDFPIIKLLDYKNSIELILRYFHPKRLQLSSAMATWDTREKLGAPSLTTCPSGLAIIATKQSRIHE